MTKIGALDLFRCVRALRAKTTVITLSLYGAMTKVVEAMKLGAIDFVEKPIDPRKTQLLCNEILQRRALTSNETVNELLHLANLIRVIAMRITEVGNSNESVSSCSYGGTKLDLTVAFLPITFGKTPPLEWPSFPSKSREIIH